MAGEVGRRLGNLVLICPDEGRKWKCQCDCGRVESYRWSFLRPGAPSSVRQCKVCDAQPCRSCSSSIPRGKTKYCSDACRRKALGLRQAEYYRSRMQVPEQRHKRRLQVQARRKNMTEEQRERRRAQNRSWFARLTSEQRSVIRDYQREWYLDSADRLAAKRRNIRLAMTSEQQAALAAYMRQWYRERLDELRQDPDALKAYHLRRRLALRRWRNSSALGAMVADVTKLSELAND